MLSYKVKKSPAVKSFTIGAIGLKEVDGRFFNRLFSITHCRNREYKIRIIRDIHREALANIDIILVDERHPDSCMLWQEINRKLDNLPKRPVIRITPRGKRETSQGYCIEAPFNPMRILKILDNYTIKELNFLPEFEIGSDTSSSDAAREGIELLHEKKQSNDSRLKALVVDDSLAVRTQLEIEFGLFDVSVEKIDNGASACQAIQQQKYDIIYLDVVMDGQDGYSVCKQIRKSPLNKNTPVILLTSKSSAVDKLKGTLAGCNSYLTKPITHGDFVQETKKFVNLEVA